MSFQVFSLASKKTQGFSSDRKKILMSLLSVPFHLQSRVSVFWYFNFKPSYLGKRSLRPWNQPFFLKNSDKSLSYREQKELKKNWQTVCRRKAAEDNNDKINPSPNIPCTFQNFFPRNLLFRQVSRTSVSLNSKCLTFLYLFISLLKNIY